MTEFLRSLLDGALALLVSFWPATASVPPTYQGYVEGEYVRLAAPAGGTLIALPIAKGDAVRAGDLAFRLDPVAETAAVAEATWRLEQAEAQLANLSKGRRPTELDVVRAQLSQAQASLRLSEAQLQRQEALVSSSVAAVSRLDEARAARDRDRARVGELTAQLASQRLAARDDEIDAARATVETAKAALAQAEWRRGQREVAAPVEALVTDTIYRLGEFVPAGAPVVSLLPRGNVKVRFFIPETVLATIAVGSPFAIECDACPPGIEGRVTFIAPNAEFTPPVIYSRESRSKLVFLVEAKSPGISNLNPGQPVDVRPVRP